MNWNGVIDDVQTFPRSAAAAPHKVKEATDELLVRVRIGGRQSCFDLAL
jgi:hypothetical protein